MSGQLLQEAINRSGMPAKAVAAQINYSVDAIYAACAERRKIPRDAKRPLSNLHPLAGLAVAYEATGYQIFCLTQGDRHPQVMIQRVMKEDAEADEVVRDLPWRLIDKSEPDDLTDEDRIILKTVGKELSERIRSDLNLLIELEDRYHLGLLELFQGKEKTALRGAAK